MSKKLITVGIPAYKAQDHICDCLASIQIQTIRDEVVVIIAKDNPKDNYDFVKKRFPNLEIQILDCEKNTGPGLARQRCADAATTEWITWIDADDVFYDPFALENLKEGITQDCIEVRGIFCQEVDPNPMKVRAVPRMDEGHPWVFGRLYNLKFLKANEIKFSALRAMEDGEFNWKIRMSIEGFPLKINSVEKVVYLWRKGSDHSITRIGIEENDGEPLYNWDLCQVGATAAAINAIKFCKKRNPFNGSITRFTVEMFVDKYFTYIQCLEKKPIFAKENFFNAKRFYYECYKEIENQISEDILKKIYTMHYAGHSSDMVGIIPSLTFFQFLDKIKSEDYRGKEEFDEIRSELPEWVIELDMKSGVLGEEGYVYVIDEKK